ncbi:biotin--[acetyl-CoA-carboxylase] ligase [Candidatus Poribacteria bacterium]|nr:biotin--[acetyl-CoA-carboxylase] ligase [Candidatus Poribacteria bacterium]
MAKRECPRRGHDSVEKEVLGILRRAVGEYVSGGIMSRRLGVSRAAVWKAVESLRKKEFRIGSRPNLGYILVHGPRHIVGLDIETGLGVSAIGKSVVSFDSVSSTIDVAASFARNGSPEGTVVVAESQTGGRGRLGRRWSSPAGCGIWCSIILKPAVSPRDAPKLTLLIAVAVARVLSEEYRINARIKWPNDVVVRKRKICGALTELVAEQDAIRYVIASFGLNVNQSPCMFPPELAETATSMRIEKGRRLDRPEVLRSVLREFDAEYAQFRNDGGVRILEEWRGLSCTLGKRVRVELREERVEGVAKDIGGDGSLIVETRGGALRSVAYGDVTLLR